MRFRALPSKVDAKSVVIACPTISTACPARSWLSTKLSRLASTTAPEPSEVGEHCSLVSGSEIIFAARMSSSVYYSWNCANGLLTECLWFL